MRFSIVLIAFLVACGFAQQCKSDPPPKGAARMMAQLRDEDWILRAEALRYLARHRVSAAAEEIRTLLANEKAKPWLRGRALLAIAEIERDKATGMILALATHKESALRAACAEATRNLPAEKTGKTLDTLLKDANAAVRYRALASFAAINGAKAWPVVKRETTRLDAAFVRWETQALALTGTDEAFARIGRFVAAGKHRAKILRGVAGVQNPKLIPILLEILSGANHRDTTFALGMSALQEFEDAVLFKALNGSLQTGKAATIRTVASIAPSLSANPGLSDAIRKAAEKTEDKPTVEAVLVALGSESMKPDRHRSFFTRHLEHNDGGIRTLAIRGLSRCRFAEIYETLRKRMEDKELSVVLAAIGALRSAPTAVAPRRGLVSYLKTPLASDDRSLRKAAQDLLAYAGSSADFEAAMRLFGKQLASPDAATREEAAQVLGSLAPLGKKEAIVRAQGYLSRFKVVGTFFSDLRNGGFNDVHPPEKSIDFKQKYTAKYAWVLRGGDRKKADLERVVGWSAADVDETDGKLMLPPLLPPPAVQSIAYAVAEITVKTKQQAVLDIDGDDAFCVWMNGKQIAKQVGDFKNGQTNVAEQKGIAITLNAGRNRFLIKTANLDNQWWIRLRLTDKNGVPVEMTP